MKTVRPLLKLLILPLLVFAGCHELGHDGPGDYGTISSGNVVGEIQYVDTAALEIEIRADTGRTSVVRYDGNTRVVYQQRNYSVSNLEPGDMVAMRTQQDRSGRVYTDLVTVRESAQNRRYTGVTSSFRGTVTRNDPRYSSMNLDATDGKTRTFYYDAQTRVSYRNRTYPVASIQAGDVITVRTRDPRQATPTADVITVVSTAQDRTGTGTVIGGRLETIDGRVEYVDSARGLFELRGTNNRLVVVNLQYNPPRAITDRFNRMREGDTVRIEGRFINQDRFELENFR